MHRKGRGAPLVEASNWGTTMITRTMAEVLTTISEDVADLAMIAHSLDILASELNLTGMDQAKIRDLQKVDALFQHLDDIAALLRAMSIMIGDGPDVDVQILKESIQLEYLKARLTDTQNSELAPTAGAVNLF